MAAAEATAARAGLFKNAETVSGFATGPEPDGWGWQVEAA